MKRKIWIFSVFSLVIILIATGGCKNSKESVRKYERMEKKRVKEEQKALDVARKNHVEMQSKATQKMMKENRKRAKKYNESKKR
jgi:hypothetical protein